jgi:excisionase family DNA binding protein
MGIKRQNLGLQNGPSREPKKGQASHWTIKPEYLSLDELARYCSVSKKTLRKWLGHGMPHFKVGRLVRVNVSEFNAWMKQDLETIWDQVMKEV